jgi:hypothetical protein
MRIVSRQRARRVFAPLLALLTFLTLFPGRAALAQIAPALKSDDTLPRKQARQPFRIETLPVGQGAEMLTVFGSLDGLNAAGAQDKDVPLVSVLRDTLGDDDAENDRLRYVWTLTYTRPGALQRLASAVPFLYSRVGDKKRASTDDMPPPVIDLANPGRDVWQRVFWLALQNVIIGPYGVFARSSAHALRNNSTRYRQAHVLRALAILSLYEAETGQTSAFTEAESQEIQARLALTSKTLGGLVDDSYLERVSRQQAEKWSNTRGHNWELLRQRAEAEGLYFDPLSMPDGNATHAILWVSRDDLTRNRGRKFGSRFLNVASPWNDTRLEHWDGFTETRYYDAESRVVAEGTPGARKVELIPLALYGLEHPKIPALLVDFRDGSNPKRREMSHRVIEDVARDLLSLSPYGDLQYFLGRAVFDWLTSRRAVDINQPTRLRAYTQLKLLLSLDSTLDRHLREEIERRLEGVSINPLENDLDAEAQLARQQYAALVAYAQRPDGLPARIERDRREELVPLQHGRVARGFLRAANVASFGLYKHREDGDTEEVRRALDAERRLQYHERFLQEVARTTPVVEVVWKVEDVRRSLRYVADAGLRADAAAARAAAKIFAQTEDAEARRLCLDCLYRINDEAAKSALLEIYRSPELDPDLRETTAQYLRDALRHDQRIAPADAKAIVNVVGQ